MENSALRHVVRLTGLPSKATGLDIVNFFCDIDVDQDDIDIFDAEHGSESGEVRLHGVNVSVLEFVWVTTGASTLCRHVFVFLERRM
jgi:hypothetical protein